jgi:hypothetical protein
MDIHQRILASDPLFRPSAMPSSPALYSIVYRALGFRAAQMVASSRRALAPW